MALSLGSRFGHYEVLSLLGEGGMGQVYRARDTRLDREVAIKVLPENLQRDAGALGQFEIEAKSLASLSHPNILAIHDFGAEDGIHFAVTELLRGETLRDLMRRGPVAISRVIRIGTDLAEGLTAAHSKGIVHRDLKPENIFLTEGGGVKILDFGLAISGSIAASDETRETIPAAVSGTLNYMSPEQVRGEPVDTRSDLYSLGCILYEMVTQKTPSARRTAADTLAATLTVEVADDDEGLNRTSPELGTIIRRCLRKDRAERFQSARDFSLALSLLQSTSQFTQTVASSLLPRRRRRWRLALLPLLVLSLAAIIYMILPRRAASIQSVAVLPFSNEGGDAEIEYLCDGLTESLIDSLSQAPGLRVMARSTVFHYKGQPLDLRRISRELRVGAILTGSVNIRRGSLQIRAELVDTSDGSQLWGQHYDRKAADILLVQQEISQQISDALRLRLSVAEENRMARHYTDNGEAFQLYLKGRYYWNKRTPEDLARGIDFFNQAIEEDPTFAQAYAGLADSYVVMGGYRFMAPGDAYPKAKAAARKALDINNMLPEAWTSLALATATFDWNWVQAEGYFRHSLELNPGHPTTHHWYAIFLTCVGRVPEGLAEIEKAEELDPLSLIINTDHGLLLRVARRDQDAIVQMKKTIAMDPSFAMAHAELRFLYEEKGMLDEAIDQFAQYAGGSSAEQRALAELRAAYRMDGERGYWQRQLEAATNGRREGGAASAFEIARLLLHLGRKDEAIRMFETAYAQRSTGLTWLKVDPQFDPLRGDPRFIRLLHAMAFPRSSER